MGRGFRWVGPSDEGGILPYMNTILSYGASAGDVDADGDLDIVVAGSPTAIVYRNEGGAEGGSEGTFGVHSFQDTGGGWLPFTGLQPVYGPILTETVCVFDADGSPPMEMLFGGYGPYLSDGRPFNPGANEALEWHLEDTDYYNPVTEGFPPPAPLDVRCTFYVGGSDIEKLEDRTLKDDGGTPWLDRNGRIYEAIADELQSGDLDGDGDQDLVECYRLLNTVIHQDLGGQTDGLDPNQVQIGVSLWINDGAGHLRDEAVARIGPAWQPGSPSDPNADTALWDELEHAFFEGVELADIDDDGDLDFLAVDSGAAGALGINRLFVNMGGDQRDLAPGGWRTGQFRVAGFPGGALASWAGDFGADGSEGGPDVEVADFDGDDRADFVLGGIQPNPASGTGYSMRGSLLMNQGGGVFDATDFGGVALDGWINHRPGRLDHLAAVQPGDFDGDGDADVVLINQWGHVHRYLRNDSTGGVLDFTDLTSAGAAATEGSAAEEGISWMPSWGVDGLAEDFDGDGVHDLFVANRARTTQDDLFLSTVATPPGPRLTRVEPPAGAVSGQTITLRGSGLSNVDTVWFEKGGTSVAVPLTVAPTDRRLWLVVPPSAPFGFGRIHVGQAASPGSRSNGQPFTHLNAQPSVGGALAAAGAVVFFSVEDAETLLDLDVPSLRITLDRGGVQFVWSGVGVLTHWNLLFTGVAAPIYLINNPGAAPPLVPLPGDVFRLEVGDQKGAFGAAQVEVP